MFRALCGVLCIALWLATIGPGIADEDLSLVAYYSFEEGPGQLVKDWSGHGNDGQNLGAKYVELGEGKGYALKFDTAAAYVDCGDDASLDLTGALTIELWLYPETKPARYCEPGLVGKSLTSYTLGYSGGCWFYVTGESGRSDCSTPAPRNVWTHIVATFDGKYLRMYSDGQLQNICEAQSEKIDHGGHFYLRYPIIWGNPAEPVFKCMLDEVKVYNRALPEAEIVRHYRDEAKDRGKDVKWFDQVKLIPHLVTAAPQLVVEADFAEMKLSLLSPGATVNLQLRQTTSGKVLARYARRELPKSNSIDWTIDTHKLTPGDYQIEAMVTDVKGKPVGLPSSVSVKLPAPRPAWVAAYDQVKVLNNLVAQLLEVSSPPHQAEYEYSFINPRDGWVFIASTAQVEGTDQVLVSIDSTAVDDTVIVHSQQQPQTREAMRYLASGNHKLLIRCSGQAHLKHLVVRAIPEMIYAELGYEPCPWLTSYGPYTWDYLQKIGLLDNINVILERAALPQNAVHIQNWRAQGRKVLSYYNLSWLGANPALTALSKWSSSGGMRGTGYYGLMVDEFGGTSQAEEYPAFTKAVRTIASDPRFQGRVFYPYCNSLYASEPSRAFAQAVLDAGYKLVEERYLLEQPTEEAARRYMNSKLRLHMLRYQDIFPNCVQGTIMNLGFISLPQETQDINPEADFKVYMDMQMNLLANDPTFFGLYGVMWYHSSYADEEMLRWAAKLLRHYCIEGKRERLSQDPYELPHLRNGDFDEGTAAWTVEPAEPGSIWIGHAPGYGWLQGRFRQAGEGNNFLVTRRSAQRPNRFSQPIRKLTPGRLYSLKMFVTDYGDFSAGKSARKTHHISINIDRAEVIRQKSFRQVVSNSSAHQYRPFTRDNPLFMTYCRLVFRARSEETKLTISDWPSSATRGGPIGQELAFNNIQIQPYLEE